MKGFILAAIALANGWLAKGFSQSGNTDVTQQVAYLAAPAVDPISACHCPSTHIIKGNFTPSSGERAFFTFQVMRSTTRQSRRNAMSAIKTVSLMVTGSPSVNTTGGPSFDETFWLCFHLFDFLAVPALCLACGW